MALAQAFTESFDGKKVRLGSKKFILSEAIIARATQTSATGERWFKSKALLEEVNSYLKPKYANMKWNSTAHISCFKFEW